MFTVTTIENSSYHDSVVLMRVASQLKKQDGVFEAALFMGTQGNHDLLRQVGLSTSESQAAGPEDLIIIIKAESPEIAGTISSEAIKMLASSRKTADSTLEYRPRTIERALDCLPEASLAAISIPGEYAAREASRCLDRDLSVFLFSDNVSLKDELVLKQKARDRGLLCMGPDCGTASINGVRLGFTNRVGRGRIGCVAASGTGLQAVMCRVDQLGEGISHAIGVGGRDLSKDIGGIMCGYALQLLDEDPSTEIIILLSKPPHPDVLKHLNETITQIQTPVIRYFQGDRTSVPDAHRADTLDGVAELAVSFLRNEPYRSKSFDDTDRVNTLIARMGSSVRDGRIVGLYTGGTLAKEAQLIIAEMAGEASNDINEAGKHIVADLGEDRYTVGKPHPMIAPENRTEILLELAAGGFLNNCSALLFDLVLGEGSHINPAQELVSSLELIRDKYHIAAPTVVAVIGTKKDPQSIEEQVRMMSEYGAAVFLKNSESARFSVILADSSCRTSLPEAFQ
jgi:FdrA protein